MAFPTDWIVNKEQPSTVVAINASTPINSVGSLRVFVDSTLQDRISLQNNTYPNGLLAGRMQSKFRIDQYESISFSEVGFTFMMNSPTLFSPFDEGYGAFVVLDPSFPASIAEVEIVKYTSGLPIFPTILASATITPPNFGETYVFEVDWVSDFSVLAGTLVTVRYALGDDFLLLDEVLSYTDTSSPLLISTTEGLAVNANANGSSLSVLELNWDDTSIFSLT
jgi:hypothetical protein